MGAWEREDDTMGGIAAGGGARSWVASHHHTGDPATSKAAAESVESAASQHRRMIVRKMHEVGVPLAAEEIADRTGLSSLQVMKRISDLRRDFVVFATDEEHINRSGRRATRWALVEGVASDR